MTTPTTGGILADPPTCAKGHLDPLGCPCAARAIAHADRLVPLVGMIRSGRTIRDDGKIQSDGTLFERQYPE